MAERAVFGTEVLVPLTGWKQADILLVAMR